MTLVIRKPLLYAIAGLFLLAMGAAVMEGTLIRPRSQPAALDTSLPPFESRVVSGESLLSPTEEAGETRTGMYIGAEAPDFSLKNLEGQSVRLQDHRGRVVLLNFWATWCGPCELEMPLFQMKFNELDEVGFTILAVDFDEPEATVRAFRDKYDLSFPILLDPGGRVQKLYRVLGYPSSVFLDGEGVIRFLHIGSMTQEQLENYLTQLGLIV